MSLVEQELFTLPEHPNSPPVFSVVRVTRPLVLCMFCRSLFVVCPFSFGHYVVCSSTYTDSDYPFGIFKYFLG